MENQLTETLNRDCHCIAVDKQMLEDKLANHLQRIDLPEQLLSEQNHLFASSPVFLSRQYIDTMQGLIRAIETVTQNANYQANILKHAPAISKKDYGPKGVFFGYDFHLGIDHGIDGPKLIEINTNAGGVLLNYYLAMAQEACCLEVNDFLGDKTDFSTIENELIDMFREEFYLQFPRETLRTIAIVDSHPEAQFLYPEFLLFQSLFERHGIKALIADPKEFIIREEQLYLINEKTEEKIDLVYNRLTDFYLENTDNACLKEAYEKAYTVFTPSPHAYALYADKRNLTFLSDEKLLSKFGIDKDTIATLKHALPTTVTVSSSNADELWEKRKTLFFKPINGYGSRGAYRGAKLTRGTWENIIQSDYIAQTLVPPSERILIIDGEKENLKVDIRCVSYKANIQQLSARLYQGQTTNLRTKGGGLATVFQTPSTSCC